MKTALTDVTFIILVRLDSIQRLENIKAVSDYIYRHFDTHIFILEASAYNNGVLKAVLNKKVIYKFVEDKDLVLHKTMYYNQMIKDTQTPFFAIWDADAIADKVAIAEAVSVLRSGKAAIVYPYNGTFFDTSTIIRELFLRKKNISLLHRHHEKMNLLYRDTLYGGAVFLHKEKYIMAGLDDEVYYGWGDEDFERFFRCYILGLPVYRTNHSLYHLSHPRGINSSYRSALFQRRSSSALQQTVCSSREELSQALSKRINPDKLSPV